MRPWLRFFRLPLLPTVWSHLLAVAWLTGQPLDPWAVGAFSLLYFWGMGGNDLADRFKDAREQPTRPLPAGDISVTAARRALGMLLLAMALTLPWVALPEVRWACATGLLSATAYNFLLKHHALAGPLAMGVTRASVIAGFAVPLPAIWILGGYTAFVTFWSMGEELYPARRPWTLRFLLALPLLDLLLVAYWRVPRIDLLSFVVLSLFCRTAVWLMAPRRK